MEHIIRHGSQPGAPSDDRRNLSEEIDHFLLSGQRLEDNLIHFYGKHFQFFAFFSDTIVIHRDLCFSLLTNSVKHLTQQKMTITIRRRRASRLIKCGLVHRHWTVIVMQTVATNEQDVNSSIE